MDAARAQARLGDGETGPFFVQQVGYRHPDVLKHDLAVAFRRVVVHHRNIAHHVEARRVHGHQHHALTAVGRRLRVGLAHDDGDLAIGVSGIGDKPLAPVDHVFVAVALDQRLDVGGVGRRHVRLGHGETGADFTVQQRLQPLFFLLRRPEHVQHFHVAGVGRVAVEHLGRPLDPAHQFGERGVFQVGQPGARLVVLQARQEHVPQAFFLG